MLGEQGESVSESLQFKMMQEHLEGAALALQDIQETNSTMQEQLKFLERKKRLRQIDTQAEIWHYSHGANYKRDNRNQLFGSEGNV